MALTENHIELAYKTARDVNDGRVHWKDGAEIISKVSGIPVASSTILVKVYGSLVQGKVFKRALSSRDMDYFLTRIKADNGLDALRKALEGLELHIQYREAGHVRQKAMRGVLDKHRMTCMEA